MLNSYSVLVNTSDGFEDCWDPFFTLFQKYWPQCSVPIYLNTETKIWQFPGINIKCTCVQGDRQTRLTWSECLLRALDQISTPLVLYFQEDYFIHQKVRVDIIESAVQHMINNPEVKHVALTKHGSIGPHEKYEMKEFKKIRQKARYRISTQAALWRVETLKSYLHEGENGWMFEIYGTWRAQKRKECFLCADFEDLQGGPAIDYKHTGIIKGKWLKEIQQIFDANEISIDYQKRGFYIPKNPLFHKFEVARKILERPAYLFRNLL